MRHIHITTADHRLLFLQFQKIGQKIPFPFHSVFQAAQFALGIRRIYRNKIKFFKFKCDHTAFFVVRFYPDSIYYRQWLFLCKYGCAGIPSAVRIIPVLVIPRKLQLNLSLLAFRLLQTENICIQLLKSILKALCNTGSDSIYIP